MSPYRDKLATEAKHFTAHKILQAAPDNAQCELERSAERVGLGRHHNGTNG